MGLWLGNKHIEQLATYIKGAKVEQAFTTPNNLTTISPCSTTVQPSNIWSDFIFAQVGDAENEARMGEMSGMEKIEKLDPLPVSHYMTQSESHMIEQWAGHVVETADPNAIISDTPGDGEGQKKVGRIRKVKQEEEEEGDEDEDEDEDDYGKVQSAAIQSQLPPVQAQPSPISWTAPKSLNDALNLQLNAQKARVGRTRILKIDEDEEEEESHASSSIRDAEEHNSWTYPPVAKSNGFGFPSTAPKKKAGRQRMLKVESDEEADEFASAAMEGKSSARPAENFPSRPRDNASAWARENASSWPLDSASASPVNEQPQKLDWDRSSVVPSSAHVDKDEVSDVWDETVYPQISSFGGTINGASGWKLSPADPFNRETTQNDRWPDQVSEMNPNSVPEGWFSLGAEESNSSRRKEGQGKAQAQGLIARNVLTAQPASTRGRGRGSVGHAPQTSTQQNRGRSINRRGRASRGSGLVSNGRSSGKANQPGRGANRFDALAAAALVDIAESEDVDPESVPVPPGFDHNRHPEPESLEITRAQTDAMNVQSYADLIDITTPAVSENLFVPPPPGFDSLSAAETQAKKSSQYDRSPMVRSHGKSPASSESQREPSTPNTGEFYVNTSNPGMNLVEMSRRRIEQLHMARDETESLETLTEKVQEDDEASTRTFHRTMNQQARKPTQKKQIDQKKAEAMQKAWGRSPSSSQAKAIDSSAAPSTSKSEASEMSAAKKRLLRGKEPMANASLEAANQEQTVLQNDQIIAALTPVFRAAKAFPGALGFEIQLGQFLSPSPEGAYQSKCVTVNHWHKLYDPASGRLASAATFTNILTRNGADVDHILKLKMAQGGGTKLFHPDIPGRYGIRFEFHCQGKNNDDFKVVFNSTGQHEIERPFRRIGQVNLHVPGQIWDAAAMLTGSTRFPEEQILRDAAAELAASIYIPANRKDIEISYRLPSSNEFAVKRVVMKRVSRHKCAIIDKHDIQLHISEVQRLFVERRPNGVYLAYASPYHKMVEQMMIHFEVSLISESIERALATNASIAVGDLTPTWTEDTLLATWRIKPSSKSPRWSSPKSTASVHTTLGLLSSSSIRTASSRVILSSQSGVAMCLITTATTTISS